MSQVSQGFNTQDSQVLAAYNLDSAGGHMNQEGVGHGMFWEADECAFAIRDGRKESQHQPLAESLVMMQVMDQIREQNGIRYSEEVETTQYPIDI